MKCANGLENTENSPHGRRRHREVGEFPLFSVPIETRLCVLAARRFAAGCWSPRVTRSTRCAYRGQFLCWRLTSDLYTRITAGMERGVH